MSFFESNLNNFTILHQNIAGLLSKKDMLQIVLHEFSLKKTQIDVICLTETFLKAGNEQNFSLNGYRRANWYSRKNMKRGGVLIMCKEGIRFKTLPFLSELQMDYNFECCGIEIVEHNCFIICIYRIPNSTTTDIFLNKLEVLLHKLRLKIKKRIIITGDFNINILKESKVSLKYHRILQNYNYVIHINEPTRLNACLDQIISNIPEAIGELHPLGLSDHNTGQLLKIPIASNNKRYLHKLIMKRDYSKENMQKFQECLYNVSWNDVYNKTDVNTGFNCFHDTLTLFYNLCFPLKEIKMKNKITRPTWLTKGIRKASHTKRKLRFRYYTSKNKTDKQNYRKYSNILKKCINTSQRLTNTFYVNSSKNVCRAVWDIIKNQTGNEPKQRIYIDKIINRNKLINDPNDIAENFNDYFINLTNNNNNNATNQIDIRYTHAIKEHSGNMYLFPTDESEVLKTIKSLKNTLAVGFDGISTNAIKQTADALTPILTYLINLSFSEGVFPDKLKLSVVKPIHKKGDIHTMDNYRPISIIPVLSKIFEKLMYSRIILFLNKFNILATQQNGFQKGKSTTLAAFNLVKEITANIDKKNPTTAIFFDMSKAFDFVPHNLLLQKCEFYGIRGIPNKWIRSYLSERHQQVEIKNINANGAEISYLSKTRANEVGVPQGSILGPLLFLIFINDLPLVTQHHCTLFADDISVIINGKNKENYNMEINNTVCNVINWLNDNNLKVNLNKTTFIQFRNRSANVENITIKYENEIISESSETKFLGLIIDNTCSWKPHVQNLASRINRFAYALWRLTKITNQQTALKAYHGYVGSILRYGILIWGNSVDRNKIFIGQKQCIRAICDVPPLTSCRPLFKRLNLLTVPCLYIFELCNFVKTYPHFFKRKDQVCHFNTRYPDRLIYPKTNTHLYRRNCFPMAIRLFNKLPKNITELPRSQFRVKLFIWLKDKTFYSVEEYLTA